MYRFSINQFLILILITLAFTSFLITRYFMSRAPSITPGDTKRLSELEGVISQLQKQIASAEENEKTLKSQIDVIQANAREINARNEPETDDQSVIDGGHKVVVGAHPEGLLDCAVMNRIKIIGVIANGHTKVVQEGVVMGQRVAVKSAAVGSRDMQDCIEGGVHTKPGECYLLANYKVLKEIMMLRQLNHRNIIGLLGMCVRSENSSPSITERGVSMAVELGKPVQLHKLKERSWPARVEICMQLAGLLEYLADSPMGSVALPDVRDEQFVMMGDIIKISDLDDIYATEPSCDDDKKCLYDGTETDIKCQTNTRCVGMNAHSNLQRLNTLFFSPLLSDSLPESQRAAVDKILKTLVAGRLDAAALKLKLEGLLT